jgi:NAD(P)-dependent dehydrogenase (short-subunit alcohol dehydrogenase family)
MAKLTGKVALVTGASRGIGRATALRLAAAEANVFLVADGSEEELMAVAAECESRSNGAKAGYRMLDVTQLGTAETMVHECVRLFDRVDVLINNAGVRCRGKFGDYTYENYEFVQSANLRTPFFACQAVLPIMRRQGGGRIVNIGSQFGSVAFEDQSLYGMTKAALIYLTKAIAFEASRDGIHVNCVSPGPIATQYNVDRLSDKPDLRSKMESYVPMGRFGEPDEVAEVIAFLATCDGAFIQGHDLLVDGGWLTH